MFLARAVFLAKRVFPACYFALHDSLRDTGPDNAQLYGEKRSQLAADKTIFCLNVVFCPPATATPTTANAGSGADSRGFRNAECHGRQDPPARIAPSTAIAVHTAMAMSRGLASMVKPALIGRRHDDVSRHPQESVSVVNVDAGEDRRGLEASDDEVDAQCKLK